MDTLLHDGWFSEKNAALWPGQYLSLQVDAVLHRETSAHQDIAILQTARHGRVLVLDGIIQCSEHDEFAYQEMMALVPLCAHPRPARVLIVGGGDGGVAREVAKHPHVTDIVLVEIDPRVVVACRRFLPKMAAGLDSPKMSLHIGDGREFLATVTPSTAFDVIITDSSDPVGPNEHLFHAHYFGLLRRALRPGGVVCSQAGSAWLGVERVAAVRAACGRHFGRVRYGVVAVPTYPTGQIGFVVASEEGVDVTQPRFQFTEAASEALGLRYYDAEVHRAAFTLPRAVRMRLAQ